MMLTTVYACPWASVSKQESKSCTSSNLLLDRRIPSRAWQDNTDTREMRHQYQTRYDILILINEYQWHAIQTGIQYNTRHTIWKALCFPLTLRLKERLMLFPMSIACRTHWAGGEYSTPTFCSRRIQIKSSLLAKLICFTFHSEILPSIWSRTKAQCFSYTLRLKKVLPFYILNNSAKISRL